MKAKSTYRYAAVFSYDTDGINVSFPDLPGCYTCSKRGIWSAYRNAGEALKLYIQMLIEDGSPIPAATPINEIKKGLRKENEYAAVVTYRGGE